MAESTVVKVRRDGEVSFSDATGGSPLVYTEVEERFTLNLIPALQADIALTLAESMRG